MMATEPTNIGLSEDAHALLQRMKEDGHVAEMADAYRLGIALALARGIEPPEVKVPRTTIFGVATIDPHKDIAAAIRALMDLDGGSVYKMAERLAEWGVREMSDQAAGGFLDVASLMEATKTAAPPA